MKSVTKLLLCLIITVSTVLAFGNNISHAAPIFNDIGQDHRAYKEITYLAQGKIASGDASGNFLPKSNVTRAEFTALIGRALGLDGTKRKTKFKDVGASNFASGHIQAAVDQNIISGYSDGTFKPGNNVTRGEMAVMICKAFGYSFGNSASGAVKAITSRGIDQGVEDGTFGSSRKALREETAIFLARAIDYTLRTPPVTTFSGEKYANTDSLNIRKGPSTSFDAVGTLGKNEKVTVGYKVGSWTLVKTENNKIGFVSNNYLVTSAGEEDPPSGGNDPGPGDNGNSGSNDQSLASQVLVIDPGHGGKDPGTIGYGTMEKNIVLDTSIRLQELLAKTPLQIKMTRSTDVYLTLKERVTFAKQNMANTFVSVHANSANGKASGSETFYYDAGKAKAVNQNTSDSKLLAQKIQAHLAVAMEHSNRGDKHGDLHVIRENSMPAVLVELGFIDNKSDNGKLVTTTYRQKAADAIFLGILDYYSAKGFNVAEYYKVVK